MSQPRFSASGLMLVEDGLATYDANSHLAVSAYGKSVAAGDTPVLLDANGKMILSALSDVIGVSEQAPGTVVTGQGAFTASSGTFTLMAAAVGVTNFLQQVLIASTNPTATVNGTFTINNLATGSRAITVVESSTMGGFYLVTFAQPLAASATNTAITLSVPAITGGASGIVQGIGYQK